MVFSKTIHSASRPMRRRGGHVINTRITLIGSEQRGGSSGYGVLIETSQGDILSFPCISYCKEETDELLARMLRSDLQIVHFSDIVRDYITELYYRRLRQNGLI